MTKKLLPAAILVFSTILFSGCTAKPESAAVAEEAPKIVEETELNTARYIAFNSTVLSESKNSRRVLFFYANWCPTCKPANEDFTQNANQLPEDVTVIRVNYNDTDTDQAEKDLAKKYGVTYQHTFVQIDAEDNTAAIWSGGAMPELLSKLQ